MKEEGPKSLLLTLDSLAESADPNLPAFLARPEGAPVYHGFPLIEATETEGWYFGAITELVGEGIEYGDGFVQSPDGSRAGLVWQVGEGQIETVCESSEDRWGVYSVWFRRPIHQIEDLVKNFRDILPELKRIHERVRRSEI